MLETIRLICDSGLMVLIWMVQLIIYPSFSYYKLEDLYKWHESYTKRIAIIVIPLLFGQLITTSLQVYSQLDFYTMSSAILVIGAWFSTFMIFIPLHANISNKRAVPLSVEKLKLHNWLRTILWSLLFLLTFYYKIKS